MYYFLKLKCISVTLMALIDGDKKMTQSNVIVMYLAKKHGLDTREPYHFLSWCK